MNELLWILVTLFAYAASLFVGHHLARHVVDRAWERLALENDLTKCKKAKIEGVPWLAKRIGYTERFIVTGLVIFNANLVAAFIAFWVGFKFAGGWKRFGDTDKGTRAIFQIGMLGNALSIGWAALMGMLCRASLMSAGLVG